LYVPGVPPKLPDSSYRRSYVLWIEQAPPTLVIELVSDESRGEEHDTTPNEGKFWIYENRIKSDYYAIYDPDTAKLELFHLRAGKYRKVRRDAQGHYPIRPMKLKLGAHRGTFRQLTLDWLRFFDEKGAMLLPEAKKQAQRANRERRGRLKEKQR